MGGEQAASVLATVKRDGIEAKGGQWSAEEESRLQGAHPPTSTKTRATLLRHARACGTTA